MYMYYRLKKQPHCVGCKWPIVVLGVKVNNMAALHIKTRGLTVYFKAFPRQNTVYGCTFFPLIQLQGKWLQDSGFVCGQAVEVSYKYGKIVITLPTTENTGDSDTT